MENWNNEETRTPQNLLKGVTDRQRPSEVGFLKNGEAFEGCLMKPYKSAGKCLSDLMDETDLPVTAETFRLKFITYLSEQGGQGPLPPLTEERVGEMYELTRQFFKENHAVATFQPILDSSDWRKRKRVLNTMARVINDLGLLAAKSCTDDLPLTKLLATSLLKKIAAIRREVDYVKWSQRVDEELYRMLKKVSPTTNFMSVFEDYFTYAFPQLQKQQQHLFIAGAALAAGIFTEQQVKRDIVARIPMRLSRARKAYRGIDVVVPGPFKQNTTG